MNHKQRGQISNLNKRMWFIIVLLIPSLFGAGSLLLGKDVNWDLKNYHYYNAYSFLENRLDFDTAPAQMQTYLNPILDLPFYWMTKILLSWMIGFILGFIQGLNLSLIFLIFWKITRFFNKWLKFIIGMCIIVIASSAPAFISELGTTFNDNIVTLFVLSALFTLINASEYIDSNRKKVGIMVVGIAGLLMGLGTGLKLTIIVYAVGSALSLLFLFRFWYDKVISFMCYIISGVIGGLLSAGYWFWKLWSHFRNPLFPFYNNIFKSSYVCLTPFTDKRFLPAHLWEYFIWPFIFSYDTNRVSELRFHDVRFALFYFLCCIWLFRTVFWLFQPNNKNLTSTENNFFHLKPSIFLISFFLLSFFLWMIQFSIYRYLITLEILVPLCFLVVLFHLFHRKKTRIIVAISAALIVLAIYKPPNWGKINWSDPYFEVDSTPFESTDDAIIIMLGYSPMSYIIPHLPKNIRFLRPEGNLELQDQDGLLKKIKILVEQQKGVIYILFSEDDKSVHIENSLARFGLDYKPENCFLLKTNTPDRLKICKLTKKFI